MPRRAVAALAAAALCLGASPAPGSRLLEDVRTLSSDAMQGRAIESEGSASARAYILQRMRQAGLKPVGGRFEHPFTGMVRGAPRKGVNLLAQAPGRSRSDRVLVISAHYDHLGIHEGKIHNGADDNASGVAALLAIAEDMQRRPPQHTVIFAFFDGEEGGMAGARAFVKGPPVPLERVALNMNLDMVARGDKGELYAAGASHYPFLRPLLEGLARRASVTLKLGHDAPPWRGQDDWTTQSDHFAFHQAKVPFVYFGVEDHPDYHQPTDDFERIPQDFFRRSAQTLIAAARAFDQSLGSLPQRSAPPG